MAFLIWCLFILSAMSFAVSIVILAKHWAEKRLLNPDSIREEKERQKRDELVKQRFERLQTSKLAPLKFFYQKSIHAGKKVFHGAYLNLVKMEKLYDQAKRPFAKVAPSQTERMKLLLDEARSLTRDLKWADAEKRYMEVLLMDNRNVDAYKGIGTIYLKQKMIPQAKETFEYLLKVKKADDSVFAAHGEIAEVQGDVTLAEDMRKKAVEMRPRLANRHAELAKFYLEQEDFAKAWPSAKRATDLDPKSGKYHELALECALNLGESFEAKKRYDKLRLLSEDHQRLQRYRERIEKIKASV